MERYEKIRNLRTDGGGDYCSNEFEGYLAVEGIGNQVTAAYSPASNGVPGGANRRFLEPTGYMLRQAACQTNIGLKQQWQRCILEIRSNTVTLGVHHTRPCMERNEASPTEEYSVA